MTATCDPQTCYDALQMAAKTINVRVDVRAKEHLDRWSVASERSLTEVISGLVAHVAALPHAQQDRIVRGVVSVELTPEQIAEFSERLRSVLGAREQSGAAPHRETRKPRGKAHQ